MLRCAFIIYSHIQFRFEIYICTISNITEINNMSSGFCAPSILSIIFYVLCACGAIVNVFTRPHKVLQVVSFVFFALFAWLLCYGLYTLCANGQVGWAWGVLGIKLIGGIATGLSIFSHSCTISKSTENQCQLLNGHTRR